ncbi:MAG TPA: hypothetical protein V6C76_07885 [Drouetiella sp.]
MTESEAVIDQSSPLLEISSWTDVFYGLMVAPIRTIEFLTHDEAFAEKTSTVVGASLIVLLSNGISGIVDAGAEGNKPTLPIFIGIEFQAIVMWLALAAILHIVCGWVAKREVDFKVSLVSVGWAFMPLVFAGPMSCFSSLGLIYNLLSSIPVLCMCALQWLVFSHSLSIGPVRTFALLVLAPPVFIVTYLFWLAVGFLAVARVFFE